MLITDIDRWEEKTRQLFTYQADPPGVANNKWLSFADSVLQNKMWNGDCDKLAETVLDLCVRAGLAKSNAYRLVVLASSDGSGHMVGSVVDDNGFIWVVGDTFFPAPYRADRMQHKPVEYNRLSESVWRNGAPWVMT